VDGKEISVDADGVKKKKRQGGLKGVRNETGLQKLRRPKTNGEQVEAGQFEKKGRREIPARPLGHATLTRTLEMTRPSPKKQKEEKRSPSTVLNTSTKERRNLEAFSHNSTGKALLLVRNRRGAHKRFRERGRKRVGSKRRRQKTSGGRFPEWSHASTGEPITRWKDRPQVDQGGGDSGFTQQKLRQFHVGRQKRPCAVGQGEKKARPARQSKKADYVFGPEIGEKKKKDGMPEGGRGGLDFRSGEGGRRSPLDRNT